MSFDINNSIRPQYREWPEGRRREQGRFVYMDAGENSFGSPLTKWYNRYPDPLQASLKTKLATIKNVPAENIFLGNGTAGCLDLLIRTCCEPLRDNIVVFPPTRDLYSFNAALNQVELREVPLNAAFQLDLEALEEVIDAGTKMLVICSPNYPTSNVMDRRDVEMLLNNFDGLVVVDEAFINFSRQRSILPELMEYPNLVVLQSLSKAWGLAGLRVGMTFASNGLVAVLNRVGAGAINTPTQELALKALDGLQDVNEMIRATVSERTLLAEALQDLGITEKVFPSDANFLLVRFKHATVVQEKLRTAGILVQDVQALPLCENCLCITVGTAEQNALLIRTIQSIVA